MNHWLVTSIDTDTNSENLYKLKLVFGIKEQELVISTDELRDLSVEISRDAGMGLTFPDNNDITKLETYLNKILKRIATPNYPYSKKKVEQYFNLENKSSNQDYLTSRNDILKNLISRTNNYH